jgi:3-deoxy-D-manno-octulosonate 8-phosphate phosphatase (KDO 8-P phosphatase)
MLTGKTGNIPVVFVLDVDGVLTDGSFYYSEQGKIMKRFGADDNDAITLLSPFIEVRFVTGDKRGFGITAKRVIDDMKMQLDLVSTIKRVEWLSERYSLDKVIYMGDGIFDHFVMEKVGYSIAPSNADKTAKLYADYVTERGGGERAVAEACLHIMEKFFEPYDHSSLPNITSGTWTV